MSLPQHCFHTRVGSDRYRLSLLSVYPKLLHLRECTRRAAVLCAAGSAHDRGNISCGTALPAMPRTGSVDERTTLLVDATKQLRELNDALEQRWTLLLEAAGVLSNSFAPFPPSNCENDASKVYFQLWCDADQHFLKTALPLFVRSLDKTLVLTRKAVAAALTTALRYPVASETELGDASAVSDATENDLSSTSAASENDSTSRGFSSSGVSHAKDQQQLSRDSITDGHTDIIKQLYMDTLLMENRHPTLKVTTVRTLDLEPSNFEVAHQVTFPVSAQRLAQ